MALGLLILSILLQTAAAIVAWRMVRSRTNQWVWGSIAAAMSLLAIWWAMPLAEA